MLQFRINAAVIRLANKSLNDFGEIWLNGSGQVYSSKKEAYDKVKFSHPEHEEATYQCHFVTGDKIPAMPEQVIKMMYSEKQKRDSESAADAISKKNNRFVIMDAAPVEDEKEKSGKEKKTDDEKVMDAAPVEEKKEKSGKEKKTDDEKVKV